MGGSQRMPAVTPMSRLVRGLRLDSNPLRRTCDRAETVVLIILVVTFLATAPVAALAAGGWAQVAAQRAQHVQAATWRRVTAVVLAPPGPPALGSGNLASVAKARWTAPDGTVVIRDLPVPFSTEPGARFGVWVTADGHLAAPPMNDAQAASLAVAAEVTGVGTLALVLTLAGAAARWSLNRRRMAGWDADWQATGPRWTTRA